MPIEHIIQAGDSITSLADQYGLFVDTIWNAPENAALRNKRKDMDILLPGDVVVIPDKRVEYVQKSTEKKHVFRRRGVPAVFRLQLFDAETPRARQEYTLKVEGRIYQGTTDADGVLEIYLPPQAKEGVLTIGPERTDMRVLFGHLDPIGEVTGIQRRLANLGFYNDEPSGEMDETTRKALRLFQLRFSLPETGELDEGTSAKLEQTNDTTAGFPPRPAPKSSGPAGGR